MKWKKIGPKGQQRIVANGLKAIGKKGHLSSKLGEATKVRGGKRKRYFSWTSYGRKVLETTKEQGLGLWNAIPNLDYRNGYA